MKNSINKGRTSIGASNGHSQRLQSVQKWRAIGCLVEVDDQSKFPQREKQSRRHHPAWTLVPEPVADTGRKVVGDDSTQMQVTHLNVFVSTARKVGLANNDIARAFTNARFMCAMMPKGYRFGPRYATADLTSSDGTGKSQGSSRREMKMQWANQTMGGDARQQKTECCGMVCIGK